MDKQVVPQVVADYISELKDGRYTLYGAFNYMGGADEDTVTTTTELELTRKAIKVHKWVIDGHQNAFALAWINGYKVGEQLYYVWFLKDDKESFLNISATDRMVCSNEHERNNYRTKFTMAEIEATDLRYKAFAIPVEEVGK